MLQSLPAGPLIFLIFCLLWILAFCVFGAAVFFPWMRAQSAGLPVSMFDVVRMRIRRLPVGLLFDALAELRNAGVTASQSQVEAIYFEHRRSIRTAAELVRIVRIQVTA